MQSQMDGIQRPEREDNIIMQRFLAEANSYAESVVQDIDLESSTADVGTFAKQHARSVGAQQPIVVARQEIDYSLSTSVSENLLGHTFRAAIGILLPNAKNARSPFTADHSGKLMGQSGSIAWIYVKVTLCMHEIQGKPLILKHLGCRDQHI